MELTIGFADTDLDGCGFLTWMVDPSNFETSDFGDDATVIIDRTGASFAHDRSEIPHRGAEHRGHSDGCWIGGDEFHSIDRHDVDPEGLDRADTAGERACIFGFSHQVQMIDVGPQGPDQGWPSHSLTSGVEHTVAMARSGIARRGRVGGRDKTPGDAEGIVNDQF